MSVFDKYRLTSFDIVIISPADGQINDLRLGAGTNYFGTVINGNGRFISHDNKTDFTVYEGETVYIPKGCVYRSEWHGTPKPMFYSLPFTMYSDGESDVYFSLQKVKYSAAAHYMKEIFDAKFRSPISALAAFYELYEKTASTLLTEKNSLSSVTASVLPAVRYIEKNPEGDFDVPYLASLCGMSESNFYALFKKQTGLTPVGYKNKLRCIRVTELLRGSNYTVEYISEKLNFSSPMYMRKVLRRFTGKTPGMIRRETKDMM